MPQKQKVILQTKNNINNNQDNNNNNNKDKDKQIQDLQQLLKLKEKENRELLRAVMQLRQQLTLEQTTKNVTQIKIKKENNKAIQTDIKEVCTSQKGTSELTLSAKKLLQASDLLENCVNSFAQEMSVHGKEASELHHRVKKIARGWQRVKEKLQE